MAKKRTKLNSAELEAEFSRLFWAAREEHNELRAKAKSNDVNTKRALAFAKAQAWTWGEALLLASISNRSGDNDHALTKLAECESSIPERWRSLFYFVRGTALSNKGEFDEAIKDFRVALEDSKCEMPGRVWNNLGMALSKKGEHVEAVNAFHKALDSSSHDSPGKIWFRIGLSLAAIGDQDEAIKAYQNAVADSKYENSGWAWNNIGVALAAKGNQDEAIEAYRKALDRLKSDSTGKAWNNLGLALSKKADYDEAIKAFREALNDPKYDLRARVWINLARAYVAAAKPKLAEEAYKKAIASTESTDRDRKRAQLGLRMLKAKIGASALTPDDRALVGTSSVSEPINEIENTIIDAIDEARVTQYEKYIDKPDSKRDFTLSILRGWSSAVTLLEGSERRWRGGGYFLKWRGCGVVIDPGFDFLRNFHDAGYHGREIRAVVVSHHHPDHNSDLKDIDDLRYELYKRLVGTKSLGSEPYVLLWDEDTANEVKFGVSTPAHHYEPIVFSSGYPQPFNLVDHKAKLPVRIIPFKVNHGNDVKHAMGIVFELLDEKGKTALRIGYTADTAYFQDLHKHLLNCDILIAHISQPSIDELKDASKLKEVHLGYRGTARLLKECKPRLALIGEFWAGFTDLRIALVKGLRQQSGVEAILPTGLAMNVNLPSLEIECTECGKLTPFAKVKVAPPTDSFGSLAYLCPKCLLQ